MILVTGGTGLVGSHLLYQLAQKNDRLKAVYRSEASLEKVKKVFSYYTDTPWILFEKIEWVQADITDIPSLDASFNEIDSVYHCAALISFDPRDYDRLLKINEEGTSNIVNLCVQHKISKLCYVSSIAAIGKTFGEGKATEENEWTPQLANVYALSKHKAEMEVWRGIQEGVPAVIINPGIIIGPGYWEHGSGVLFKTAAKAHNFYPPGTTSCIGVNDTVGMMIALMNSEITAERYIAVSDNISYRELLSSIQEQIGKPVPEKELKFWQLKLLCRLDWLKSMLTGTERTLTKTRIAALKRPEVYDNSKIKKQLNFKFQPLAESIAFACSKFKEEHA